MKKIDIVMAFYGAWGEGDLDKCMSHCTDDLLWDNVPMKPFEGKEKVRSFLEKFAVGMSNPQYEIKSALENEETLMIEGVEKYEKNGHSVAVPYMASFEFRGDKIAVMRDYFDLKTVERQLGLAS